MSHEDAVVRANSSMEERGGRHEASRSCGVGAARAGPSTKEREGRREALRSHGDEVMRAARE